MYNPFINKKTLKREIVIRKKGSKHLFYFIFLKLSLYNFYIKEYFA